jgi:cell shape-determining protein MreC
MVGDGLIEPGDTVVSDPAATSLPTAMIVGNVVQIVPERTRPLFCTVAVKAAVDAKTVERVYIFDPGDSSAKSTPPNS